jgi:PKD repeat protein
VRNAQILRLRKHWFTRFFPDFKVTGSCVLNPYQFTDLTTSKYGIVNSWHWDFGDPSVTSDTSTIQNPAYKYPSKDSVLIQLIVTNSKGALDTVAKAINISDRPTITLPFHDTLICNIDTLQLHSTCGTASAIYSWSPSYNISNVIYLQSVCFTKNNNNVCRNC